MGVPSIKHTRVDTIPFVSTAQRHIHLSVLLTGSLFNQVSFGHFSLILHRLAAKKKNVHIWKLYVYIKYCQHKNFHILSRHDNFHMRKYPLTVINMAIVFNFYILTPRKMYNNGLSFTFWVEWAHVLGLFSVEGSYLDLVIQHGVWIPIKEHFVDGHVERGYDFLWIRYQLAIQVCVKLAQVATVDTQKRLTNHIDLTTHNQSMVLDL